MNGSCSCQSGWSGANCGTCAANRCVFNESNAFLYNITQLANQNVDYTFVMGNQEYYINLLANTNNACGGLNTPVCQKTGNNAFMSLGSLNTEDIESMESSGVMISYMNGTFCPAVNQTATTYITIHCVPGAVTEIVFVNQPTECTYTIEMNSGLVCPTCAPGYFGSECVTCGCMNDASCNDGLYGNGTCNCKTGFAGAVCDICDSGYFGSDCRQCSCDLANSLCMDGLKGTGHCICYSGYSGDNCDSKSGPINQWAYAGVGLAIGLVVGVAVAVGICMFMNNRKRQYETVKE